MKGMVLIMTKQKKIIAKISIWLFIALLLFTAISQIIYQKLLPKVEVTTVKSGPIDSFVTAKGYADFTDQVHAYAESDCVATKILLPEMQEAKQNEPIIEIDVAQDKIAVKQFELAVLSLSNQIKQAELTPDKITAQKLQLDILNQQLKVLENSQTPNSESKKKQLQMQIQGIERQIKEGYVDEAGLATLKTQLSIAQEELALYEKNVPIENKIATNQLSLSILQAQTQLKKDTISQQQVEELKKQLDIANDQLRAKKASFETSGKIVSLCDGKVSKYYVKEGDRITKGQLIADIASTSSKPCVSFALSKEAGEDLPSGCKVVLKYKTYEKDPISGITSSKMNEITAVASFKKYNPKENNYIFSAPYDEKKSISREAVVDVKMIQTSTAYTTILPKACVTQNKDQKDCIFVITKKQGLFKQENVVKEVEVKVLDRNNINVAIDSFEVRPEDEVLLYSSKPIKDGSVISVVKE
ncbi:hypothetical protein RBG61_10150 [Paludicola sp. MB14-C6]|uniref:hypothetical protein n=1 Tax=Paludihabitans sp. MB14-C6 TaxID=3070656 RepID=UPI0027DBD4A9|nr:hypothetical protein [Paludicola sp. MB14-C6]WMJ22346.1 hypothetical protein RBG61_10150 [Paludicola sp. MB14-C6]